MLRKDLKDGIVSYFGTRITTGLRRCSLILLRQHVGCIRAYHQVVAANIIYPAVNSCSRQSTSAVTKLSSLKSLAVIQVLFPFVVLVSSKIVLADDIILSVEGIGNNDPTDRQKTEYYEACYAHYLVQMRVLNLDILSYIGFRRLSACHEAEILETRLALFKSNGGNRIEVGVNESGTLL